MAKITYEHQTDGEFCGDCKEMGFEFASYVCLRFNIQLCQHKPYCKQLRVNRCQQCIDKFGK